MPARKAVNPFYFLVVVVGVAFCITASAFGLMALRQVRGPQSFAATAEGTDAADHPLLALMQTHGMSIMLVELGLLALFTLAAIGTDQYWSNRKVGESIAAKEGPAAPECAVGRNAGDKKTNY